MEAHLVSWVHLDCWASAGSERNKDDKGKMTPLCYHVKMTEIDNY